MPLSLPRMLVMNPVIAQPFIVANGFTAKMTAVEDEL
jgi:hypothetical protein